MKIWRNAVVAAVALGSCASLLAKERLPAQNFLADLVRDLDDDNYFVRERALEKLTSAGMPALPALGQALVEGSPEAAWRASAALEQIAIAGDEKQLQQVANLFTSLSRQKPHLAKAAQELAIRQQWARHERAVVQLRSLGGQMVGAEGEFPADLVFADVGVMEAIPEPEEELAVEDELPAEPGIFGAIRAIAKALIPDLDAPPEPLEVAEEGAPGETAPAIESPDVEIIERAAPAAGAPADVEIVEEAGPILELADAVDVGFAFGDLHAVGMADASGSGGVSQVTLGKSWLGGDEGLKHLRDLKGLTSLVLEDAPLTEKSLRHLETIPTLQQLTIRGGTLTSDGLRKLRTKRPDLQIWAFGSSMMGVGADMESSPLILNHIYPRSGAQEAGLAAGDVVKRIDGVEIRDFTDLMLCVFQRKVGDALKVEFERDGKAQTAEVVLKARQAVERAVEDDPFR